MLMSTKKDIVKSRIAFFDQDLLSRTDSPLQELFIVIRRSKSSQDQDYTVSDELISCIRKHLSQSEYVEKILFVKEDAMLRIWTAVSSYSDEKCRRAVYHQELLLMDDLLSKRNLHFDFYLIEPQDVEEILSGGAALIFDRKNNDEKH